MPGSFEGLSQCEMEAGAGHIRNDERVARATEEDADERHDESEAAEESEQHDRGLALRRPRGKDVSAVDIWDECRTDEHERRHQDACDRRVEVGEKLLEPEEVPRG